MQVKYYLQIIKLDRLKDKRKLTSSICLLQHGYTLVDVANKSQMCS